MTQPRLKQTVTRQTSIIIIGLCVLGFAIAYFSREPFPYSSFSSSSGTMQVATSTPQTAPTVAQKTKTKPTLSTKPSTTKATAPAAPVAKAAAAIQGVGSLNDLLAMREALSCSVTARNGTGRNGTAYFSGQKFRIDLSNGVSLINDASFYYAWAQGASTGLVLPLVSVSGSTLASHGALDPAQSLSYACNHWTSDASLFVVPASVTFTNTSGN